MKSVSLGWIVNPQGQRVFGSSAVQRLANTGAQYARFALDLGGHSSWDSTILGIYQGFLNDLTSIGITPIALVSNGAVPGPYNQQTDWNANNKEVAGGSGSNPYQKAYTQSLQALVSSLGLTHWELWNEPNAWTRSSSVTSGVTSYSGGSFMYPSCYAALLEAACPVIPATDVIITGGLFCFGTDFGKSAAQYLYNLYTVANWTSYNAPFGAPPRGSIGLHLYPDSGGALGQTNVAAIIEALQSVLWWFENPSKRTPRDFYVTEAGWQSGTVGLDQQAANLQALASALGYLPRIPVWSWFTLDDNPGSGQTLGLYDSSGNLKPAGQVFQAI